MKSLIQDEYREMLKAAEVVANFPRHGYVNVRPARRSSAPGPASNVTPIPISSGQRPSMPMRLNRSSMTPSPTRFTTPNASPATRPALNTTRAGGRKPRHPTLPATSAKTATVPGQARAADPDNAEFRKLITLKAEQANTNGFCHRCHDAENSRHFDFTTYWEQNRPQGQGRLQGPEGPPRH